MEQIQRARPRQKCGKCGRIKDQGIGECVDHSPRWVWSGLEDDWSFFIVTNAVFNPVFKIKYDITMEAWNVSTSVCVSLQLTTQHKKD